MNVFLGLDKYECIFRARFLINLNVILFMFVICSEKCANNRKILNKLTEGKGKLS